MDSMEEPVVKDLVCPQCAKTVKVRVLPSSAKHRFQCPHCKGIQDAQG
jgi:transposase-like protein